MRLLHTSDWHLGVSMNDASCEAEQRRFLDWLIDTLAERAIDVLVVAGDIFHFRQPSNTAQRLYYDFLRRAADVDSLQKVVVVAGNHDSPTGLESPKQVLETLDVVVVGALRGEDDTAESCLVPLRGDSGEVEMAVCAVPYVRTAELGVSGFEGPPEVIREAFEEAFRALYSDLADMACERWGDIPLVTTGHLTCGGDEEPDSDDFNTNIHAVGTIEAMSPSIFDGRYDYVALGHIHRAMPVEKPRVWYSGTPVATSQKETSKRYVIDVDISSDGIERNFVEVPQWRSVHRLKGSTDEVLQALEDIEVVGELRPYVFVHIQDDDAISILRLQEVVENFEEPKPRLVEYRFTNTSTYDDSAEPPVQLDELSPEDVFIRLYKSRTGDDEPDEELLRAFRSLLADDPVADKTSQSSKSDSPRSENPVEESA